MATEAMGWLSVRDAIREYKAIGLTERADKLTQAAEEYGEAGALEERLGTFRAATTFEYTGLGLGFVNGEQTQSGEFVIKRAATMAANEDLKNTRINVKLDGFVAHDLPFRSRSEVLLEVSGHHHIASQVADEPVAFAREFAVRSNGASADRGLPVFNGLVVPPGGVGLSFRVVFLKNDKAHEMLNFLNSAPVASGLSLVTTANPAIAPFTSIVKGLVSYVATRKDGKEFHKGYIGLDFTGVTGVKLDLGTYVVAQIPGLDLPWSNWVLTGDGVMDAKTVSEPLPYNYFLLRVETASVGVSAQPAP